MGSAKIRVLAELNRKILEADIKRLVDMGATHKEGPIINTDGGKIGFISAPGGIRLELIEK